MSDDIKLYIARTRECELSNHHLAIVNKLSFADFCTCR